MSLLLVRENNSTLSKPFLSLFWPFSYFNHQIKSKPSLDCNLFLNPIPTRQGPSIRDGVLRSGLLLYLHHRDSKIFFHPAKFNNSKDEKISDFKTESVSQKLAGLKTGGLVGL